jgi:hypothetical protein
VSDLEVAVKRFEALLAESMVASASNADLELGVERLLAAIDVGYGEFAGAVANAVIGTTEGMIRRIEAGGERMYWARMGILSAYAHGAILGDLLHRIRDGEGVETHWFVYIAESRPPTTVWRIVYDGVHGTAGQAIDAALREALEMGNDPSGFYMAVEGRRVITRQVEAVRTKGENTP